MAPTPIPDTDFFTIDGNQATLTPDSRGDDWDNLQYILDTFADMDDVDRDGATIRFSSGTFFLSYMVVVMDPLSMTIEGNGTQSTTLVYGTEASPILPLDLTDRHLYMPTGVPWAMVIRPSEGNTSGISCIVRDMSFEPSKAHGFYGSLGFYDQPNCAVDGVIVVKPSYPTPMIYDVDKTMTGTTPQALGETEIFMVTVCETANNPAGTKYEEDTDYTIDYDAGTITRIALGAISGGQHVFVTFGVMDRVRPVSTADVTFERLRIAGGSIDFGGLPVKSAIHGIKFEGSFPFVGVDSFNFEFPFLYQNINPFQNLTWTGQIFGQAPMQLMNGSVVIRECEFVDISNALSALQDVTGIVDEPGENEFSEDAWERSKIEVTGCTFTRCGYDPFGGFAVVPDYISGTDVVLARNTLDYCRGMGVYSRGVEDIATEGFVSAENTVLIEDNKVLNAGLAQEGFGLTCLAAGGSGQTGIDGSVIVRNNLIEVSRDLESIYSSKPVMSMWGPDSANVTLENNTVRTVRGARSVACSMEGNGGIFRGNSFSDMELVPAGIAVHLTGDSSNVTVVLNENDSYTDDGSDNTITGGISR